MYKVELSKKVIKFLEKHSGQPIIQQLEKATEILSVHPFYSRLDVKKLKGTMNQYRLRLGEYRLLYEVVEGELTIYYIDIGSRRGIYK